jgi:hypothetical protein
MSTRILAMVGRLADAPALSYEVNYFGDLVGTS